MKHLPVGMALIAVSLGSLAAQETKQEGTTSLQELRIYLLDRAVPKRPLKDASAAILVARERRPGTTLLVPLVKQAPAPTGEGDDPLIRGLVGSPYFVELVPGNSDTGAVPRPENSHAAPAQPAEPGKITALEILKRAHQGPCFLAKVPASLLAAPCRATITVRLDDLTFTSEEFQIPSSKPEQAAADARSAAKDLWRRVEDGEKFAELKPAVLRYLDHLHELAPAAFRDDSGALEPDRQWCLAMGRKLVDACDRGDGGEIQVLSLQCEPRLKRTQEFLAEKSREPDSQPPVVK